MSPFKKKSLRTYSRNLNGVKTKTINKRNKSINWNSSKLALLESTGDSSLDLFDQIKNGPIYNVVKTKSFYIPVHSSDEEAFSQSKNGSSSKNCSSIIEKENILTNTPISYKTRSRSRIENSNVKIHSTPIKCEPAETSDSSSVINISKITENNEEELSVIELSSRLDFSLAKEKKGSSVKEVQSRSTEAEAEEKDDLLGELIGFKKLSICFNTLSRKSTGKAWRRSYLQRRSCKLDQIEIVQNRQSILPNLRDNENAKTELLKRCKQTKPIPFKQCYRLDQTSKKIGEGVYGEVFQIDGSVVKIIPLEGEVMVNGEEQKKFYEIITEIVTTVELDALQSGFVKLKGLKLICGQYPKHLLKLWDEFDELKVSENDRPSIFSNDQLYIALELENGGKDLESFEFTNAQQAFSAIFQVACALALAENKLKFEHRDLHWGNVLLAPTTKKFIEFQIQDKLYNVETCGVQITIIDFTLSRIECKGTVIFNDLALDLDLFENFGEDYQFEVYRLMKKRVENDWRKYEPWTNILWLHYLLVQSSKFIYMKKKSKVHAKFLRKLTNFKKIILEYKSAFDFVSENFSLA